MRWLGLELAVKLNLPYRHECNVSQTAKRTRTLLIRNITHTLHAPPFNEPRVRSLKIGLKTMTGCLVRSRGGVLGWAFISAKGEAFGWWVPVSLSLSNWSSFVWIREKGSLGEVIQ